MILNVLGSLKILCHASGKQNKLEGFQSSYADSFFWHGSVWRAAYCLFIINDVVETYIHQCSIDVVTAFPIYRDEERQASVWRQHIHAAILFVVSRQKRDAAVFNAQRRSHHI